MARVYRLMRCDACGARLEQADIILERELHHRYDVHLLCWSCGSIVSLSFPIASDKERPEDAEGGDQEAA